MGHNSPKATQPRMMGLGYPRLKDSAGDAETGKAEGSSGERPSTCPGAYLETEMVEPGLRGAPREQAGQEGQEEPARRRPGPGEEPGTAAAAAPSQRHLHSSINIARPPSSGVKGHRPRRVTLPPAWEA